MKRILLCTLLSLGAAAAPKPPRAKGIESPGYKWNAREGETLAALKKKGDAGRGEETFAVCVVCHQRNGGGTADGVYPKVAGQHPAFLIKQLADIRVGLRDNPFMYPYAATLTNPQELADVSAYVASLPSPRDNGQGPGSNLNLGRQLYQRDCAGCHGANGEGDAARFFPLLAGQHYRYLLRQVSEVGSHLRRNANPDMVRVLRPYTEQELEAVCDYASRLPPPR